MVMFTTNATDAVAAEITIVEHLILECLKYLCNSVHSMDARFALSHTHTLVSRYMCVKCVCVCIFFNCSSVICFYVLSLNWLAKCDGVSAIVGMFCPLRCIDSKGEKEKKNIFKLTRINITT